MKIPFALLVAGLLFFQTGKPCLAGTEGMVKLTVVVEDPQGKADAFGAKPKVITRSGFQASRTEEEPDTKRGVHLLFIVNEPDAWMIDLTKGVAQHSVDQGPTFEVHMPVFNGEEFPEELKGLEFGLESEFFGKAGKKLKKGKKIEGRDADAFEWKGGDLRLLLYQGASDGLPLRLEAYREGKRFMAARYLEYRRGLPFDAGLFKLPKGVRVAHAQDPKKPTNLGMIETGEDLDRWMNFYYLHPLPHLVPPAIAFMDKEGVLENENAQPPVLAFFSRVFQLNPALVPEWMEAVEKCGEPVKISLWMALWLADIPYSSKYLNGKHPKLGDFEKKYLKALLEQERYTLKDMPLDSGSSLDMLWGAFFADGDASHVRRIISTLPGLVEEKEFFEQRKKNKDAPLSDADKQRIMRYVVASAAQWSLGSNARRHERVLKACQEEQGRQKGATKGLLAGILKKAREK